MGNLPYVKTIRRRGEEYHYFNTGQQLDGKPLRVRLPSKSNKYAFGAAYATLLGNRTKRANISEQATLASLAEMYMNSQKFTKRALGTQRVYRSRISSIVDYMGQAPLDDITRSDIRVLLATCKTAATGQYILTVFRNLINFAMNNDLMVEDPSVGIEVEHVAEPHEPWPEELIRLGLADTKVQLPISLLYYTAQRIGDICAMRWTDIVEGTIEIVQQKGGKPVSIPVHYCLRQVLETVPKSLTTIICDAQGRPFRTERLRTLLQNWASEHGHNIVPHGLRKNGVSALLEAGCTVGETSAISGQSLTMVEHYARGMNRRKMAKTAMAKWEAIR